MSNTLDPANSPKKTLQLRMDHHRGTGWLEITPQIQRKLNRQRARCSNGIEKRHIPLVKT